MTAPTLLALMQGEDLIDGAPMGLDHGLDLFGGVVGEGAIVRKHATVLEDEADAEAHGHEGEETLGRRKD